jgi:hypothetical protein
LLKQLKISLLKIPLYLSNVHTYFPQNGNVLAGVFLKSHSGA